MKTKDKKTLATIFTNPVNGNMEWSKIEALLVSLGCKVIEGSGSSVTFEKNSIKEFFHRPHPAKEALIYRVKTVRSFLIQLGITQKDLL